MVNLLVLQIQCQKRGIENSRKARIKAYVCRTECRAIVWTSFAIVFPVPQDCVRSVVHCLQWQIGLAEGIAAHNRLTTDHKLACSLC